MNLVPFYPGLAGCNTSTSGFDTKVGGSPTVLSIMYLKKRA